jgi:sulfide:quinone oxidoreductase
MKQLLILGGGTAGTLMANKLARALPAAWSITVVDRDDAHLYQPGLLFLPFGMAKAHTLVRPRHALLDPRVRLVHSEIERVSPDERRVVLPDGVTLSYDLLVIATGCGIRPELTEGMTGSLWHQDVFDFYTLEGSAGLQKRLDRFTGGRLVIDTVDMPIKCPVAPLEFAFLADAFLRDKGLRDRTEIVYATPLDWAFTKPRASAAFGSMLERRGIEVVTNFNASAVDDDAHLLRSYDGRELAFDLLVAIPLHAGAESMKRSGLGDEMGFVPTDKHTLASKQFDDIFVLGDATDLPSSKAGAVAHFQGDVVFENVLRRIDGRELWAGFDGHANCFIETGHDKAMMIDFNYDTEPLPGRFPLPGVGPFTLLEESHANHWGKLAFQWIYWNLIVRGKELPLDPRMPLAGKWSAP